MAQLGGHAAFIESKSTQISHGDTAKEIGVIFGRYFDVIAIRQVDWGVGNGYLNAVAEALNNNPGITKVQIEGHTDNEGTEAYNQKLSEDRAKAVRKYLIGKKVDPKRLMYKGYGFSRPKASNRTEEGKAINRRVEFTIVEKD